MFSMQRHWLSADDQAAPSGKKDLSALLRKVRWEGTIAGRELRALYRG
jgi:hypothetical protein